MTTCRFVSIPLFSVFVVAGAVQAPTETRGVTERQLSTVDLGPYFQALAGRELRMRLITIDPGGATVIHSHDSRPGTVYILQGKITDHRDGVSTEYGPGPGWPEDKKTTHWIENKGTTPAVEISVDIFDAR